MLPEFDDNSAPFEEKDLHWLGQAEEALEYIRRAIDRQKAA